MCITLSNYLSLSHLSHVSLRISPHQWDSTTTGYIMQIIFHQLASEIAIYNSRFT